MHYDMQGLRLRAATRRWRTAGHDESKMYAHEQHDDKTGDPLRRRLARSWSWCRCRCSPTDLRPSGLPGLESWYGFDSTTGSWCAAACLRMRPATGGSAQVAELEPPAAHWPPAAQAARRHWRWRSAAFAWVSAEVGVPRSGVRRGEPQQLLVARRVIDAPAWRRLRPACGSAEPGRSRPRRPRCEQYIGPGRHHPQCLGLPPRAGSAAPCHAGQYTGPGGKQPLAGPVGHGDGYAGRPLTPVVGGMYEAASGAGPANAVGPAQDR